MDFARIVEVIEKRRDALRGSASIGTAADPLVASAAQVAWDKAPILFPICSLSGSQRPRDDVWQGT